MATTGTPHQPTSSRNARPYPAPSPSTIGRRGLSHGRTHGNPETLGVRAGMIAARALPVVEWRGVLRPGPGPGATRRNPSPQRSTQPPRNSGGCGGRRAIFVVGMFCIWATCCLFDESLDDVHQASVLYRQLVFCSPPSPPLVGFAFWERVLVATCLVVAGSKCSLRG